MKTMSIIKVYGIFFLMSILMANKGFSQDSTVIEIKDIDAQKALIIKAEVETSQIGPKMGELYGKLFEYTGKNNIQMTGAPFAVYYSFDPTGKTAFEVACPVASKTESKEGVEFKEYPAMKAVTLLYKGAYENMMPAYEKLQGYIAANNLKSTGIVWEVYLTNPEELKDQNNNQTVIYFPIEK